MNAIDGTLLTGRCLSFAVASLFDAGQNASERESEVTPSRATARLAGAAGQPRCSTVDRQQRRAAPLSGCKRNDGNLHLCRSMLRECAARTDPSILSAIQH